MTKLIAETAWHHEGDFLFMKDLVSQLCEMSSTDVIKMHITLDFDEYMSKEHDAYNILKKWLLSAEQWEELIDKVRLNGKELMLLLNDTSAIKFAAQYNSELVELHSVCLNVPSLQQAIIEEIDSKTKIIIGVGGCSLQEIDKAVEAFKILGAKKAFAMHFGTFPLGKDGPNTAANELSLILKRENLLRSFQVPLPGMSIDLK